MAIPILNELNEEIKRLYIAGSPLAKGDPRIKKYIQPLEKLGQRAPVFAALAAKLTELTEFSEEGGKSSPENLMETGTLLYSVLYTQGAADAEGELLEINYAEKPLTVKKIPHSKLHPLIDVLLSGTQTHSAIPEEAFKEGYYDDPRLYPAYVKAVTPTLSYVSNFVADTIIPAIGRPLLPFLKAAFNINGDKRDARLFKIMYKIAGNEILPLSEKVMAEGSAPVIVEAIYTLCENPAYEETLLSFTKDKKAEVRQAAFSALAQMGSKKGGSLIIEGLGKASVTTLLESVRITNNPDIISKAFSEVEKSMEDWEKRSPKIKGLLKVFASREEDEGLELLRKYLSDKAFFAKAQYPLELYDILQILYDANTPAKDKLLYDISTANANLDHYRIRAAIRLFPADKVFDECCGLVKKNKQLYNSLLYAYDIGWGQKLLDESKKWDRRWAQVFIDNEQAGPAYTLIFDDDEKSWQNLLDLSVERAKKETYNVPIYGEILGWAYRIGFPKAESYFEKFDKAKYPKEMLEKAIEKAKTKQENDNYYGSKNS